MNTKPCGCTFHCDCSEQQPVTAPQSVINPAGTHPLSCRVGTYASFFEALQRRLSSRDYPQLRKLHTRKLSDPSIALLDAWATVGDVLTFYNERLINEGYLKTATEQRSLAELSDLIGYRPGPGIASSVYLAFTLEKTPQQAAEETLIPKGTAVKSVPGDNELPQTFETTEDLIGREEWNAIRPRMEFPQNVKRENLSQLDYLYISGLHPKLKPNDLILVFPRKRQAPEALTITEVVLDQQGLRTRLSLRESPLSRASLYRDTLRATNNFLIAVPNPVPTSLRTTFETAKELLDGNAGDISDLSTTTALADVNARIDNLINTVLKPVPLNPLKTIEELSPPAPPSTSYISLTSEIRKLVDHDANVWIAKLNEALDYLTTYSTIKDKLEAIADDLGTTTPFTKAAITAAKKDCPPQASVPTPVYFPKHTQNLTDWIKVINALDPVVESTHAAYKTKLSQFKRWWNGALSNTPQDNALQELAKSLQTLIQTVQNAKKSGFPFTGLAESTEILSKSLTTALSDLQQPGSTVAERLTEVKTAFEGMIDLETHASELNTIRVDIAFPAASVTPLVDSFVVEFKQIKTPWDLAVTDLEKHNQAIKTTIAVENRKSDYIRVSQSIINDILPSQSNDSNSLADVIKRRNDAFLQVFDRITTSVSDLSTSNSPNAKSIIEILDNTHDSLHGSQNKNLADKAEILLNKSTPIPTGAVIQLQKIAEPPGSVLGKKIAALIEQLKSLWQVITEPGNSTLTISTGETFESGGIANALQSDDEQKHRRSTKNRSAHEALSVPDKASSDIIPQLISAMHIKGGKDLLAAWRSIQIPHQAPRISLVGGTASLFGFNAPRAVFDKNLELVNHPVSAKQEWTLPKGAIDCIGKIYLSQETTLPPWGTVYLRFYNGIEQPFDYSQVKPVSRSDYGLNGKTSELTLTSNRDWRLKSNDESFDWLRKSLVLYETDTFDLSNAPITQPIGNADSLNHSGQIIADFDTEEDQIELDGLYLGISPGHVVIVRGELASSPGVIRSELARVRNVRHLLRLIPGDRVHTRLFFESDLTNTYIRESVTIYANVVNATHGETVHQILGSGDTRRGFQKMPLKKGPLTYLSAPTASGVESTLSVRVNDLLWHEKESLIGSPANGRDYVIQTGEAGQTAVEFGDGKSGARLPTGQQNVRAVYRVGLGVAGNIKSGRITQLAGHRPLGLKGVNNPLPATGGADPENTGQIRTNAPLAVMALDRLVSVRDYADFTRNYAGIEKACAKRLYCGGQSTVHITIAGAGDSPIAESSDLFMNLLKGLRQLGDPLLAINVQLRELLLIFLSARVRLLPDFAWEFVEPAIRAQLFRVFSFSNRNIGQDLYLSEALATIQQVKGVAYVDMEVFGTLSQSAFERALRDSTSQAEKTYPSTQPGEGSTDPSKPSNPLDQVFKKLRQLTDMPDPVISVSDAQTGTDKQGRATIFPAQIACLSPAVPDSLFLTEIKND